MTPAQMGAPTASKKSIKHCHQKRGHLDVDPGSSQIDTWSAPLVAPAEGTEPAAITDVTGADMPASVVKAPPAEGPQTPPSWTPIGSSFEAIGIQICGVCSPSAGTSATSAGMSSTGTSIYSSTFDTLSTQRSAAVGAAAIGATQLIVCIGFKLSHYRPAIRLTMGEHTGVKMIIYIHHVHA